MDKKEKLTVALNQAEKQGICLALATWLNSEADCNCEVTVEHGNEKLIVKSALEALKYDFNVIGAYSVRFPFVISFTSALDQTQTRASALLRSISNFLDAQQNFGIELPQGIQSVSFETVSYPYLFNVQKEGFETVQSVYQLTFRKESEY